MAKKKRRQRAARRAAALATPEVVPEARTFPVPDNEAGGAAVRPDGPSLEPERFLPLRFERSIVVGMLVLCAINMVTAGLRNSAVADELGAHIPAGHLYWASGQYSGGIDNFALGQLWIALPVKLLGLDYELFTEQHLLLFRLPVMVLGLLVALTVYLMARRLWGPAAGLAALFLTILSPNILAHSTLATLDLPTTCAVFVAVFLLCRYVEAPSIGRLMAMSIAIAVALVIKIQAVLLLPIVVVALAIAARNLIRGDRSVMPVVASWLLIPLTIVVVVNLVYLEVPLSGGGLLPEPYLDAFRTKLVHGGGGHFAYLLGSYSSSGWWYYFPVAILLKTPIPALLLVVIGLARRQRLETMVFVLLPIVLFLGVGMVGRLNIGLRHVLPIYPFLFVMAGAGAARLMAHGWRGVLLGVLSMAYALQALWIHPHHLSYFNLLAGGPSGGYRFLIDSNYDWGQNDRFLARHVARSNLDYQIDPDPFHPTSGPILVNTNALFGVLNGGPKAYTWLRDLKPDDRVAYTWFEYRLPEGSGGDRLAEWRRLDRLGGHLQWLRRDPALADARLRLSLARTLAAVTLYGPAFHEIRAVLDERTDDESALRLGGELIVRHKLGVLRYRGQEYLQGFRDPPGAFRLEPHEVVELALDVGAGEQVSTLYTLLGSARFGEGKLQGAIVATRMALALDRSNNVAGENLQQMEAIARRTRRP